jgi:outer membrane protein
VTKARASSALLRTLFSASVLALGSNAASAAPQKKLRVALLADHAHDADLAKTYAKSISEVASSGEAEVVNPEGRRADSRIEGVRAAFDALLADKGVDLIVAIGALGSWEAVHRASLPKPVIAAAVVDSKLFGAPHGQGDASAAKNLTYVSDDGALGRDLTLARDLGFQRPAILVGSGALHGIPGLAAQLGDRAKAAHLSAAVVPVEAARPKAAAQAIGDADGAILFLADELPPQALSDLCAELSTKKLRILSTRGPADLQAGAAVALPDAKDILQRARRVGIDVLRIASGEAPASIPVAYSRSEVLTFNLASAAKIGWSPPYSLLADAETIGEGAVEAEGEKVDLRGVVDEVVKKNLDFEAGRLQIESQNEDEQKAVSYLLPQVTASIQGVVLDPKRAQATFGLQPQRQLLGVLEGKGIVFSDKVWANLSIQRKLVLLRELQREGQRLDLVLEAAKAYLGVLQTRVLERVRIENVKKTRANLSHATTKKSIGSAMPTEVLRWESQLSLDRREVLKARSLRKLAEVQLNRLRHRPLEEAFTTEAERLETEMKNLAPLDLVRYIEDARAFAVFRDFLVEEGVQSSPELHAVDEAIAASERAVSAAWRSIYVPTIAIAGQASYYFAKGGRGAGPPDLQGSVAPELLPFVQGIFPPDIGNFIWQVAGVVSLPIPIDTAPFSDIRRAEADLAQRNIERTSAKEKVEQRIRSAAFLVSSSMPGVNLAQSSAEAAQRNLAIAQEAYATGALGVLEVLDAQNLALVAQQLAVSAEYDFMIDQIQLERAVGSYYFLKSKDERDAWVHRAIEYLEKHR